MSNLKKMLDASDVEASIRTFDTKIGVKDLGPNPFVSEFRLSFHGPLRSNLHMSKVIV